MDLPTDHLTGAILLAIFVAVIKYVADRWAGRRHARLKRLNAQLELLYGPMLALSHANDEAWKGFRAIHRPTKASYWDPADAPSAKEAEAWRMWIQTVFMPINERLEKLVITQSHLLISDDIPRCLLELCSHVEAYRGVIAEWRAGDTSHPTAPVEYPNDILPSARVWYSQLKAQQVALVTAGA